MAELSSSEVTNGPVLQLVLLRSCTSSVVKRFIKQQDAPHSALIGEIAATAEELWPLWDASASWQEHSVSGWMLLGGSVKKHLLPHSTLRNNAERCAYVQKLNNVASWAFIPWGVDYTGMMVAFISSNSLLHELLRKALSESTLEDYFVSAYTAHELRHERFRGVMFSRISDLRGSMIWDFAVNPSKSALLLRSDAQESPLRLPPGAKIVLEFCQETLGRAIQLRWVRVQNEDAFVFLTRDPYTSLVVGGDVPQSFLHSTIQDYEQLNRDPLRFGLRAVRAGSWTYVPRTEQLQKEIYVNANPDLSRAFITSDRVTQVEFFQEDSFC